MPQSDIETRIAEIAALMHAKLGVRGATLRAALGRAGRRLPRRIRAQARLLAEAEPFAHHPKLRLTLDTMALGKAAGEVEAHLEAIDLADRRKGWWLGMLGGLAFNILAFFALLVVVLRWRGFI
ncbi:hypothetical protein [Antarcticimicrobium luteum]|uniref:Uncharacterized protein n=1 Tax=Antarcticimicrobium luteum TaxID=2547397 RepID=A0A4R5VGR1_9RHOB|nr:hypothetical protein [Antarcticimicrobium luteum]TDK52638.1 hypothetical protein E1832_01380 [Antarcticimicrobium luteum]